MKPKYPNWPFLPTDPNWPFLTTDPMPSIMNDKQIWKAAIEEQMITPFIASQVKKDVKGNPVISYGLSSFGYDIRIGGTFKVFTNAYGTVVDPKDFDPKAMTTIEVDQGEAVIIPPNSFALGLSVEYFRIPRDVVTICVGKSTYARCGIIVNVTPFEPEWRGYAVLEISNTTQLPAKVYAGEGIAQVLFFRGEPCEVSYADRKGKYQNQQDIVTAKV